VQKVYVAPGKPARALEDGVENVAITAIPELIEFVQRENIELTVRRPGSAGCGGGWSMRSARFGLKIFGPPTKAGSQLESSKDFAKRFMTRHNHPHRVLRDLQRHRRGEGLCREARRAHLIQGRRLAAARVWSCDEQWTRQFDAIDMMLRTTKLGDAGRARVIEEFLAGEEASFIVMADARMCWRWRPARTTSASKTTTKADTGGMGAYSPAPRRDSGDPCARAAEVSSRDARYGERKGIVTTGFLYAGLMISPDGGLKVLGIQLPHGRSRDPAYHAGA